MPPRPAVGAAVQCGLPLTTEDAGLTHITITLYNYEVISDKPDLDRTFRALGDPTRREMLRILAAGERGVVDLATHFSITQPAVTKHLNTLEEAGLISRERRGRFRMCRLDPSGIQRATGWLGDLHAYWEARLDAIDRLLEQEKEST